MEECIVVLGRARAVKKRKAASRRSGGVVHEMLKRMRCRTRDSSKYRMVRWLYEVETSAMVWKERLSDRFY